MTVDEKVLESAQDQLSQKIGQAVHLDKDFLTVLAAFARDMIIEKGGPALPHAEMVESAAEWLADSYE